MTRTELPLYFWHIPRTGGTSFRWWIEARFRPSEVFPGSHLEDLALAADDELNHYRFFAGHFGAALPVMLGWNLFGITLVRDPVDAVLSRYGFMRDVAEHAMHAHVCQPGYTFADFLRDPACEVFTSNWQAGALGLFPTSQEWDALRPFNRRGELPPSPLAVDEDELFQRASATIDRLDVVGVSHRLDETLAVLAHHMGWSRRRGAKRANASVDRPRRSDLTPDDLRVLDQRNRVDNLLFTIANERLDDALRMMPSRPRMSRR